MEELESQADQKRSEATHGSFAIGRRRVIQGAAGAALLGVVGGAGVAQAAPASAAGSGQPNRPANSAIDVHVHYLPADYRQALINNGITTPDGIPFLPAWDPAQHIAMMDRLNIATSILSVSSPGVDFGEDPVAWARSVNESGRNAVRDYKGRFGLFASLPLPDVDASLAEIRYAFDVLHADGIVFMTNYQDKYIGDPHYAPIYQELNRRRAVVFIHPTSPACWEQTSLGYPRPMIEFLFDTTRAVVDMTLNGTLLTYPNIRFIIPHAGAALPVLADRVTSIAKAFPLGGHAAGEIDVLGTLNRLYYEVGAGAPFPRHAAALLNLVDPSRLMYGTDYPFGAEPAIAAMKTALEQSKLLNARELRGVLRGNASSLFPRLAR